MEDYAMAVAMKRRDQGRWHFGFQHIAVPGHCDPDAGDHCDDENQNNPQPREIPRHHPLLQRRLIAPKARPQRITDHQLHQIQRPRYPQRRLQVAGDLPDRMDENLPAHRCSPRCLPDPWR